MNDHCTIELFHSGAWHQVASVSLMSDAKAGWQAKTYTGYADAWAIDHAHAIDAWALCTHLPVSMVALSQPHWPVFLLDMLPQGYGRRELLKQLGMAETTETAGDWPLLLAGAGNPIGHLRVKEAVEWVSTRTDTLRGFTDQEVAERAEDFVEHLAQHGLFVAGSSGVQGEWPKLLLTRANDGLLYLDHALPDELAREHYIVKFGRGPNERLAQILRHEAPYMAIAKKLGLRVHADLRLQGQALFVPRFDRVVTQTSVQRLAQESLAVLTNSPGFGVAPTHEVACEAIARVCSNPLDELCEYLRRDVANLALGNKDNHARNCAITRDFNGHISLSPVFDFAPMYLHPDGIARCMRWACGDAGKPDWSRVVDEVSQRCSVERNVLVDALVPMARALREVLAHGLEMGIEADVLTHLRPGIQHIALELENLDG